MAPTFHTDTPLVTAPLDLLGVLQCVIRCLVALSAVACSERQFEKLMLKAVLFSAFWSE